MWAMAHISISRNRGLLLNSLDSFPQDIKVLVLACLSGFLVFIYLFFQYLLNSKHRQISLAFSFLIAGILSNTLDKISHGFTIDFIPLGPWAFNLADIMILGSLGFVAYQIISKHDEFWFSENNRKKILVSPRTQILFGFKCFIVVLSTSFLLGLFSYTFIKGFILPEILIEQDILKKFILLYSALALCFSIIVFFVGIYISQRFAGPLVALSRFVDDLKNDEKKTLTLRQGDYFKQLEDLSSKISDLKK